jgi:23S rRNA U2552 (ribose-2'-O)-methylase RlmE/FtsJ
MDLQTLDELANKYNTDKGTAFSGPTKHGYTQFYENFMLPIRHLPIRLLEIGICMEGTEGGHSLNLWLEYFSNASVFTFDIEDMSQHPSIKDNPRVKFFQGDQNNREDFTSMYNSFGNEQFDFIIEDGSHRHDHQMISFGHLFKYVKSGGFYILEDMTIPGQEVYGVRNDETSPALENLRATGKINCSHMLSEEKSYIEENFLSLDIMTDVLGKYATSVIYKK